MLALNLSAVILSGLQVLCFTPRRDHQNYTLLTWEDCSETESRSCWLKSATQPAVPRERLTHAHAPSLPPRVSPCVWSSTALPSTQPAVPRERLTHAHAPSLPPRVSPCVWSSTALPSTQQRWRQRFFPKRQRDPGCLLQRHTVPWPSGKLGTSETGSALSFSKPTAPHSSPQGPALASVFLRHPLLLHRSRACLPALEHLEEPFPTPRGSLRYSPDAPGD